MSRDILSQSINIPEIIQGEWTPTIQDSSLSDGESQTYSRQTGHYIKIGRHVLFRGEITITSLGSLTGGDPTYLAGLPFTSSNENNSDGSLSIGSGTSLDLAGGAYISGLIDTNRTYANLLIWDTVAGSDTLTITELSAGAWLRFHGHYIV